MVQLLMLIGKTLGELKKKNSCQSRDQIWGGEGADTIWGDDYQMFATDMDKRYGDEGTTGYGYYSGDNSRMFGDDTLHGGVGEDEIFGGAGDDYIYGDEDDDTVWGGSGEDVIWGGDGDDELFTGSGWDVVFGGDGCDYIYSQDGGDVIWGGACEPDPMGNDF